MIKNRRPVITRSDIQELAIVAANGYLSGSDSYKKALACLEMNAKLCGIDELEEFRLGTRRENMLIESTRKPRFYFPKPRVSYEQPTLSVY